MDSAVGWVSRWRNEIGAARSVASLLLAAFSVAWWLVSGSGWLVATLAVCGWLSLTGLSALTLDILAPDAATGVERRKRIVDLALVLGFAAVCWLGWQHIHPPAAGLNGQYHFVCPRELKTTSSSCTLVTGAIPDPLKPASPGKSTHVLVRCTEVGGLNCEIQEHLQHSQVMYLTGSGELPPSERTLVASDAQNKDAGSTSAERVSLVATVLAVVLAVVTLIATKTAADAQATARQSIVDVQRATDVLHQSGMIAMTSAQLTAQSVRLEAMSDSVVYGHNEAIQLKRVISQLIELFETLLPGAVTDATEQVRLCGTTLAGFRALGVLPSSVMTGACRRSLRLAGRVVGQRKDILRAASAWPTDDERRLLDLMAQLATHLQSV